MESAKGHSPERYDSIGLGYDTTRKADAYLSQRMYELLKSDKAGAKYLDIGCGTGNYTVALYKKGLSIMGIDPSSEMLRMAREKNSSILWKKGHSERLGFPSRSVDGILLSLTIHHWKNLYKGFKELSRVLKKEGKVVLFTSLPSQTKSYWLYHYFPTMIEESIKALPSIQEIEAAFSGANLSFTKQEPYFVKPDLEDLFLYSGKHTPELYLREEVRKGISSFSLLAHQGEINTGLKQMSKDIASGKIKDIMAEYEHEHGDYLFIVGQKK